MEEIRRLESWKEIAAYLRRSVRTCRRWEDELGLPIHRLDGMPSARVFAYPNELDRWMEEKLNHVKGEAKEDTLFWRTKKKRLLLASGAVMALGAVALLVWPLLFSRPAPVPLNNPILAILPFENLTGDEALEDWRTAFPDLLITDLRQSRYVNVVPVSHVCNILHEYGLEEAKAFVVEDLAKIADKTEAGFVATGSLVRSGEDIVVNVFLHDVKSKETAKNLRASVRGEQALLDKTDDLTKEIKRILNLTPRQIASDVDEDIHRIATKSPQAFKLYSRAFHKAWRWREPFPDLVPTLQKAIGLDPEFALAYTYLYLVYGRGHIEDSVRCYEKALSLSGRLAEREKLLLQARFYHSYKIQGEFVDLSKADIPASTIEKLGPIDPRGALDVWERMCVLYPDCFGDTWVLSDLSRFYKDIEEFDKAIAVLERGMKTPGRMRRFARELINCYRFKGLTDKAEKILEDMHLAGHITDDYYDTIRRDLAWDRGNFEDVLSLLRKEYSVPDRKAFPYAYHSAVGFIHWLRDDLDEAEKAYRTVVDPNNLHEEWQRSVDLAALSLSRGKVGQAVEFAKKGLELTDRITEFRGRGREREFHYELAYFYRLLGRLPEALDEAEAACRDYKDPDASPVLAMKFLHLRALITLETGRLEEFEGQIKEIKEFVEQEHYPKLMRAYYHLLGLRELRGNHGHRAIGHFSRALDLSAPGSPDNDRGWKLYSLAEAYELVGNRWSAFLSYDEIADFDLTLRGSFSGDIYAKSFYRKARFYDYGWSQSPFGPSEQDRMKAIENYRKFLSLWGDADPVFPEVADAKARLAALEAE